MTNARPLAAEFLGTFALVFVGAGSVVVDARAGQLGVHGIAFAHAAVLAVMVTATMRISGGHLNPAVTLALWMTNHIDARRAGSYAATQLLAGVVAAFLVKVVLPQAGGEATGFGSPFIAGDVDMLGAIMIEGILTFFLVSAFFGTVVSSESPAVGGFAIGLVLLFAILIGGPLTGASLNPARAFGPALIAGEFRAQAAYWIGPLAGGAVGALLWGRLLLPKNEAPARSPGA